MIYLVVYCTVVSGTEIPYAGASFTVIIPYCTVLYVQYTVDSEARAFLTIRYSLCKQGQGTRKW